MVKPIPPLNVSSVWPVANYVNPDIRSHGELLAFTVTFTTIMVIITAMRLYVRLFMLRTPGLDDLFNLVAAIFSIGLCVTMNMSMNYGWDRHIWDQKPEWFQLSELFQWCVQNEYLVLITCAKLSALCTYLRVSPGLKLRRFIFVTMAIVAGFGIAILLATIFECQPVHLYWTSVTGEGCSNEDDRLLVGTIINIITDLLVVFIPIPIIRSLRLPLRDKIYLGILMCLGFFATIASVIRTVVMSESITTFHYDMTWNCFAVWEWVTVEVNLAISCISIPILRPLIRKLAPWLSGAFSSRGKGTWNFSFVSGSILKNLSNSDSSNKEGIQSDAEVSERPYHEYLEKVPGDLGHREDRYAQSREHREYQEYRGYRNDQGNREDEGKRENSGYPEETPRRGDHAYYEPPRAGWPLPRQWDIESAGSLGVLPQAESAENLEPRIEAPISPKPYGISWLNV